MWEELYKKYNQELTRYAGGLCQNSQEAEDLTQEVFLRALQNADTVQDLGPSQVRAWLYQTLKNLFRDRYRRARLEDAYLLTQRDEGYLEPGIQAVETGMLLASLTPEDRMLFQMRYEEGYNASELAEMFHIPAGTIRARLSRTRTILKTMLQDID